MRFLNTHYFCSDLATIILNQGAGRIKKGEGKIERERMNSQKTILETDRGAKIS